MLSENADSQPENAKSSDKEHKADFSTDVEMGFTDSSEIIE